MRSVVHACDLVTFNLKVVRSNDASALSKQWHDSAQEMLRNACRRLQLDFILVCACRMGFALIVTRRAFL